MNVRILILDDEEQMVEILKRYLEPLASKIDTVEHLADAINMARTGKYNVIIQDIRLQHTGKSEALLAIREFKRFGAAVVVVSGVPDPALKDEVLAAGADVFVPKDQDFGKRAMLMAASVATLKLPAGSYRSDSYLQHVELLRRMVEEPETPTQN